MKNKPSELFEGPNSSLHKAYVKVIERKSKEKRPIDLYDNPYQNEVWEAENEVIINYYIKYMEYKGKYLTFEQ